jgi:hypothetical protein
MILAATYELESALEVACDSAFRLVDMHDYKNYDDIGSQQKIVLLLKRSDTREGFWPVLKKYLPQELSDSSELDSLFNNEMLPHLLLSGIQQRIWRNRYRKEKRLRKGPSRI